MFPNEEATSTTTTSSSEARRPLLQGGQPLSPPSLCSPDLLFSSQPPTYLSDARTPPPGFRSIPPASRCTPDVTFPSWGGSPTGKSRLPGFRSRPSLPLSPPHFEDSAESPQINLSLQHRHGNANVCMSVTAGMHDLSLESSPTPGKVRRRNAITEGDIFGLSQHLQKLEDLNSKAIRNESANDNLHKEMNDLSLQPRRKKPTPRFVPKQSQQPPKMSITLHEDLNAMSPQTAVPSKLIEQYMKKRESKALILYTPPEKIVEGILSKKSDDKELGNLKVGPKTITAPRKSYSLKSKMAQNSPDDTMEIE